MLEKIMQYIEYIKTPEGSFVFISVIVPIIVIFVKIYLAKKSNKEVSKGGRGGDAKVSGLNSTAIGGKGGGAGSGGKGGDGGSSEAIGDNVFAMGGEGGEAGQSERGGKGGRGPLQVLREDYSEKGKEIFEILDMAGITEEEAKKYGKGGDGASLVK